MINSIKEIYNVVIYAVNQQPLLFASLGCSLVAIGGGIYTLTNNSRVKKRKNVGKNLDNKLDSN